MKYIMLPIINTDISIVNKKFSDCFKNLQCSGNYLRLNILPATESGSNIVLWQNQVDSIWLFKSNINTSRQK